MAEAESFLIAGWRNRQCSRPRLSIARVSNSRHRAPPLKDVGLAELARGTLCSVDPWIRYLINNVGRNHFSPTLDASMDISERIVNNFWGASHVGCLIPLQPWGIFSYFYRLEMEMEIR